MHLSRIDIHNVRIISSARLEFSPTWNLVCGPNGSGKTSLLEAILVGTAGKSFRTHKVADLISNQADQLRVVFQSRQDERYLPEVCLDRSRRSARFSLGGKTVQGAAEIAHRVPVVAITPLAHALVDGGPRERRRFLDWVLFHVEQEYLPLWQRYHRALRHRNVLLRGQSDDRNLSIWENELAEYGIQLHERRAHRVRELNVLFHRIGSDGGLGDVTLDYIPGWRIETPLLQQLAQARRNDAGLGHTALGPHRADLCINVEGRAVAGFWSRGQAKLGAASLSLAQAELIAAIRGVQPIVLIDDFGAELDSCHRERFAALAGSDGRQVIATVTSSEQLPYANRAAVFHVEQGRFQKAV